MASSGGSFLLSLFLVATCVGRALSAELLRNRIVVSDEYLTPTEKTGLEVEIFAEGLPVDLSGIEVEWSDAAEKIRFSEQSGGKVFATPIHYDGLAFDLTYIEARILLNERNVTLETRVVILRPWGKQPTLSDRPFPSGNDTDAAVDPRLCVVYPAKSYWLREFWLDLDWAAYYPSLEEQYWKGEPLEAVILGGGRDAEVFESGRDISGRAVQFEFSPWDRSKVDLFYFVGITVSSYECIVDARWVQEYSSPGYRNCIPSYMRSVLQHFMWIVSRATFSSYGQWKLRSQMDSKHNAVEWVFDVNAPAPTATPDPTCYEQQ